MLFHRRDMIAASVAALALAPRASAVSKLNGELLSVGGRRFWVEDYGPRDAPVLLYIHGGPGMGVFEFSHFMRDQLSPTTRLILLDQRGVLRSDPLAPDDVVTYERIASDFEAIRNALRIPRWGILGHSWGGAIALHYATAYPRSISHVILENPVLDPAATGRNMLGWAAVNLETAGKKEAAASVRATAGRSPQAMWEGMDVALNSLPSRQALYVYDPSLLGYYGRISAGAGIPDDRWEQGIAFAKNLLSQSSTFEPAKPKIEAMQQPTLLVRGQFDPSTSPEEQAAVTSKPNAVVVNVPGCSHFVHVEKPARMADAIRRLLRV